MYGDPLEKNGPMRNFRSLEVIGNDTDRSDIYDFLLVICSNRGSILYRFRYKRVFDRKSKISPIPMYLTPRRRGFALEFCNGGGA